MTLLTDVFIKSFNRPYYLERCIRSIHQHLKGDYQITILDDGTPAVYLDRIKTLFPSVKISCSSNYDVKLNAIEKHFRKEETYTIKSIPSKFWHSAISQSQDVFLLLEEDSWLTDTVDLREVQEIFSDQKMMIIKLAWHGNESVIGRSYSLSPSYDGTTPTLPIENLLIARPLIRNSLKIKSILTKIGLMSTKFLVPYYGLYSVTSAFFRKDYWLFTWEGEQQEVNESRQLVRALEWAHLQKNIRYGKSKNEKVKTSFITSATNTRHSTFDMLRLNYHFNELWLAGDLNAVMNMPADFSIEYLCALLDRVADPDCSSTDWKKWIANFKMEYASIGCVVD